MNGVQGLQGRNGMLSYTQGNNDKSFTNEKLEKRFPFWRERGTSLRLGESRIHYVNQKEWQQYDTPCLFIKRLFAESIPCNSKGIAPTRPSDVKALTRES